MLSINGARRLLPLLMLVAACNDPSAPPTTQKVASMDRSWFFLLQQEPNVFPDTLGNPKAQPTGVVSDREEFGDLPIVPDGLEPVGKAEVFSNGTGTTYWADAQAPHATAANGFATGAGAQLDQTFTYVVDSSANPVLKVTVTAAEMEAVDFNPSNPTALQCREDQDDEDIEEDCSEPLVAGFTFQILAAPPEGLVLLDDMSTVALAGHLNHWHQINFTDPGGFKPAFAPGDFVLNPDVDHTGDGTHASLKLVHPISYVVPLDGFVQGDTVEIRSSIMTWAEDRREGESFTSAYFRDPITPAGVSIDASGLHLVSTGTAPLIISNPSCSGTPGSGGTLEFAASDFITPEEGLFEGKVTVTRSGSTTGPVTVKLTTGGGTATADGDYVPLTTTVRFGDGEGGNRVVRIPLRGDTILEPNKTVGLTLSEAGGCATIGSPSSATLTIRDDDHQLIIPTFSVGGSLSGLSGAGLLLRDANTGRTATPTGNGPFTVDSSLLNGAPYDVRVEVQPSNPLQVCTVANGSGTVSGANITDIAVSCTTPTANGPIDPTFGSNGRVLAATTGAAAMALQADGKIVTVGKTKVARFTSSGTIDGTFGSAGQADFLFDTLTTGETALLNTAQGVAIQSDGKIVVTGFITTSGVHNECGVIRYNSDGTLDQSFGLAGRVLVTMSSISARCHDVALSGESIIVAGEGAYPDRTFPSFFNGDFAVARLTAGGVLDSTFGFGGFDTTDVAGLVDRASVVRIQSDGKIVVAGSGAVDGGANPDIAIVRYLPNGFIDSSFNVPTPGRVLVDLPGTGQTQEAVDMVIQPDGSLVIVGETLVGSSFQFLIGKFLSFGGIDRTFGTNGFTTTPFTTQGDFARGIALSDHGLIVVGRTAALGQSDFAIARYTSSGQLDTSFGDNGKVVIDMAGGTDVGEAVVTQPDGKIIVAGTAQNGASNGLGMVRINP